MEMCVSSIARVECAMSKFTPSQIPRRATRAFINFCTSRADPHYLLNTTLIRNKFSPLRCQICPQARKFINEFRRPPQFDSQRLLNIKIHLKLNNSKMKRRLRAFGPYRIESSCGTPIRACWRRSSSHPILPLCVQCCLSKRNSKCGPQT